MSGDFLYSQTEQDRQKHVRQGIAEGQIGCHQETVKGKADGPDDQIPKIYFFGIMIFRMKKSAIWMAIIGAKTEPIR